MAIAQARTAVVSWKGERGRWRIANGGLTGQPGSAGGIQNPKSKIENYPVRPGFTLVEILVVVALIALLVAILVSVASEVMKGAYEKQTMLTMESIRSLINRYRSDRNEYPPHFFYVCPTHRDCRTSRFRAGGNADNPYDPLDEGNYPLCPRCGGNNKMVPQRIAGQLAWLLNTVGGADVKGMFNEGDYQFYRACPTHTDNRGWGKGRCSVCGTLRCKLYTCSLYDHAGGDPWANVYPETDASGQVIVSATCPTCGQMSGVALIPIQRFVDAWGHEIRYGYSYTETTVFGTRRNPVNNNWEIQSGFQKLDDNDLVGARAIGKTYFFTSCVRDIKEFQAQNSDDMTHQWYRITTHTYTLPQATVWTANTFYQAGDCVVPPVWNGFRYMCVTSGAFTGAAGKSGANEPGWPTSEGGQVDDNQLIWEAYSKTTRTYPDRDLGEPGSDGYNSFTQLGGAYGYQCWVGMKEAWEKNNASPILCSDGANGIPGDGDDLYCPPKPMGR